MGHIIIGGGLLDMAAFAIIILYYALFRNNLKE